MSENSGPEFQPEHQRNNVGGFKLQDRLGAGGEGVVYKGVDESTGEEVAIKVLRNEVPDPNDIQLLREKKPWWKGGKHVVRVIPPKKRPGDRTFDEEKEHLDQVHGKVGEDKVVTALASGTTSRHSLDERPNVSYLVTELAREGALKDILEENGVFSVHQSTEIALQMARAIDATHANGLVYGDLKPSNVFVKSTTDYVPDVVLGDYGTAGPPRNLNKMQYTIPYAAPEQMSGDERVEFASDVYSLGLLLYEMQTGKKFFSFGPDKPELWTRLGLQLKQDKYDSFVRSRLDVLHESSPETAKLLESMLQLDPYARPDIKEVKRDLSTISEQYAHSNDIILKEAMPTTSFASVQTDRIPVKV